MKKIILRSLLSFSLIAVVSSQSFSNDENPVSVSAKVLDNFQKTFQNSSEVLWSAKGKATCAYFKQNGSPVRVVYNEKGKLQSTTRYYDGDKIPMEIRNTISRNGFDLDIVHATEIRTRYSTSTFVNMENRKSYLTVQILPNGEISVVQEYKKA